jgi:hypothetical protein
MLRYFMSYPPKNFRLSGPVHGISKWINRIISKRAHAISKILFILESYKFLAYLECIRSYAWSKGHSDLDPSRVCCDIKALNTIEAKQKKCERFEKDSNIKTYTPAYLIPISEKRTIHSIVMYCYATSCKK